jgi:hypothetical protein
MDGWSVSHEMILGAQEFCRLVGGYHLSLVSPHVVDRDDPRRTRIGLQQLESTYAKGR